MMTDTRLYTPFELGKITLNNRFVMAPMTRSRADVDGLVPNDMMATYYAQRASAGLIVTEATQISLQGMGYARTPGIYSEAQVEGWKKVTAAVHAAGGRIYLQLWHVGRVSSSKVNTLQPLAPSARIAANTSVYVFDGAAGGDATFTPVEEPREMSSEDIVQTINDFRKAAQNAMRAGFDGVEIHGANGYLIDQFLRTNSNFRSDEYGGSVENRVRFLMEVTKAVAEEVGAARTGVRLSPFIKFKDMDDPEILTTIMYAAGELDKLGIAYIHLCEADWDDAPRIPEDFRTSLRATFGNAIIATGNKTPEEGNELIAGGLVDLIGFGRKFLANPDYVARVAKQASLNEIVDTHTLFGGGGERGYIDYPSLLV